LIDGDYMKLSDVRKFEETGMTQKQEAKFLQKLVNSGMAWKLPGVYGRNAMRLIKAGAIMLGKKGHKDYYGNYVPSRYEVKAGTPGSPQYVKRMRAKLRRLD